MISFINGIAAEAEPDHAVIDVGGVGYLIYISPSTFDRFPDIGDPVKLFTYMSVKEDGVSLYGFLSKDELSMFKLLISVSGIGPKGGLAVLSALSTDDLRFAILSGDSKTLSKAPGVGKKTAERLVLELHDKISNDDITRSGALGESDGADVTGTDNDSNNAHEAIEALSALGYSPSDAMKAVRKVIQVPEIRSASTELILKAALKEMI